MPHGSVRLRRKQHSKAQLVADSSTVSSLSTGGASQTDCARGKGSERVLLSAALTAADGSYVLWPFLVLLPASNQFISSYGFSLLLN